MTPYQVHMYQNHGKPANYDPLEDPNWRAPALGHTIAVIAIMALMLPVAGLAWVVSSIFTKRGR